MRISALSPLNFVAFACVFSVPMLRGQDLQSSLAEVEPTVIVEEAKASGDAARGAIVFHQPHLGCIRCHALEVSDRQSVGPVLTMLKNQQASPPSDVEIVESLLMPSKRIRPGYETVTLLTGDGKTVVGRVLERSAKGVKLQEPGGQTTEFASADVESLKVNTVSIMPAGQVNQLGSRQQFLDLVRYLLEIRDQGVARAKQLQPAASLLIQAIPEYESHIDHATLIQTVDQQVLKRGEAIYQRVCANCHGTLEQPGTLPTSLRFASGKFKNGSDPYSMYQTLTHGFGMMTPQIWMVPRQKYEVIHYIRETYLKDRNPSQWIETTDAYVQRLPKGDTLGPEPSKIEPWSSMDYGPSLTHTFEVPGERLNIAYKGVAIRLDSGPGGIARGNQWMVFDTDTLRWAAGWQAEPSTSRFIDWRGIQFNGEHQIHPRISGKVVFANAVGPGPAHPETGALTDEERVLGRDGRRYGPLPKNWAQYLGLYHFNHVVTVAYRVGSTTIHEQPSMLPAVTGQSGEVYVRHLWIGPRDSRLVLRVADDSAGATRLRCGLRGTPDVARWRQSGNDLLLEVDPGQQPVRLSLAVSEDLRKNADQARYVFDLDLEEMPIEQPHIQGGPALWPQEIETLINRQPTTPQDPLAVDILTTPESNPWLAQVRMTGVDFFRDGRLAVCTWDGDVWIVRNKSDQPVDSSGGLIWKRIASGMFQPLGIKVVDEKIYVTCRDQLVLLQDLNEDGSVDFYQCFNNDHQVTEHFHEFAMGLQRDQDGNFYYAKSARHALKAIVPHHGTLLKVAPDGSSTQIIAYGFRAANGVCLNPDGSFVVTDQEGHWNPKNRINWVEPGKDGKPRFYGNMFGYHNVTDSSDSAMEQPLCWITNAFDRSPGELLWVDSPQWGPLQGALLNLSYGTGKVFLVPHERTGQTIQGGMIQLPIPAFPTGVMRGRFHPLDHHLYLCGMFAWAGNAQKPGGFYRIRATGQPMHLPYQLHCRPGSLELEFTSALEADSVKKENFVVKTWSLRRTANYGSKHFDEAELDIVAADVDKPGTKVRLTIPSLSPTWCMEIKYALRSADGQVIEGTVHNTIHQLGVQPATGAER